MPRSLPPSRGSASSSRAPALRISLGVALFGGLIAAIAPACTGTNAASTEDGGQPAPSCPVTTSGADSSAPTSATTGTDSTGQSTESVEWVSFHTEIPFQASDFHALVAGLFATDAQAGKFIDNQEVSPGVYLTSTADPTTPQQSRVSLTFDDGTPTHRTLALVPASFDVGDTFLTTIDAAITTMQSEEAQSAGSSESYLLQYQVTSPKGGTFSFGVRGVMGTFSLVLDVASPTTNLAVGKVGTAATSDAPYDSIAGTVYFHMTKDDFDYFVQHAYGTAAAVGQNFNDFELVPHNWLRLTVTPHLTDKYVDVGFKVLANDGTRIPIASAPASVLAGATFQALVDHSMATMNAQEAAKAGSSTPFSVPFFYNAPTAGGVVQVIVNGTQGVYLVDYAVASPRHKLTDVPFNAYKPVVFTPPDAGATAACDKLGNPGIVLAPSGAFDITFTASTEVLNGATASTPLVGDIFCSTYKASDVTVAGPNANAVALQSFQVKDASFQPGAPAPHYLTGDLPDGTYQVLCGQDLHHDGNVEGGDPVTIPIGALTLACNLNPVTVQFALLDPQ
jgi:hypothetical protein